MEQTGPLGRLLGQALPPGMVGRCFGVVRRGRRNRGGRLGISPVQRQRLNVERRAGDVAGHSCWTIACAT
jgi:hypothetical protein